MLVAGGSTNVTTYFAMRLAADGTAATGLTATDFDLQYVRSGAAPSTKVDATAGTAGGAAAHVDNTVVEPDATDQPGLYRIDWPDAAFAAGVREVILTAKVATAFTEHLRCTIDGEVNVVEWAGTDVVAGAIPAAAADAAGGLVISDAGGLDIDAMNTNINDIETDTAVIGAAGAGLTAIPWNAAWDTEVQSECTDALNAYDPPTNTEMLAATAVTDALVALAQLDLDTITGTDGATLATAQPGVTFTGVSGGAGLTLQGEGAGAGLSANGGASGAGIYALGGATTGGGIVGQSQTSTGVGIEGLSTSTFGVGIRGRATGTTSTGISAVGASYGVYADGDTNGTGIYAVGDGTGPGMDIVAGATGVGLQVSGGSTLGSAWSMTNTSGDLITGAFVAANFGASSLDGKGDWNTVVPDAAGVAPTVTEITADIDANSTQLTAIVADTGELQTDWANGGRLDLILDIIAADTTTDIPALIAALNDIAATDIVSSGAITTSGGIASADTKKINGATVVGDGNATPWDGA